MKIPGFGTVPRSQVLLTGLLVMLIFVAVVQVQWWIADQAKYSAKVEFQLQSIVEGRSVADASMLAAAHDERSRRDNQYAWEGAFFLTVLTASLAGVWRALYGEIRVRQRQDSFLALVSHQFKTPLASLKLAIETLILRAQLAEPHARIVDRALDDVQRLEDLISNILESARLDDGRVQLRRDPLPVARLVAQTLERVADRARRAGVEFELQIPAPLQALADPVAADAVLRNVLENAIASIAPLGSGRIQVTARQTEDRVELQIADSGVGIDPAEAALLFQKFGFTDQAHRSGERTGLGLYISRRLMELGGGDITARSDGLGHGATFTLHFPAASAVIA
jgi:signal transduction histidine kinase